jgi:hypothetical protein
MSTTEIPDRELAHILLNAFRYSLGRMSYITGTTADWLIKYWYLMPTQWRMQIHEDIIAAISRGDAGNKCDIDQWERVLGMPVEYQK